MDLCDARALLYPFLWAANRGRRVSMPTFGRVEHLNPHELWRNEATEFTPWLADQLDILGEALGLDLELVERESAVGDFACDLLAQETGTNRPIIIENQLEPTNHQHLGQLL